MDKQLAHDLSTTHEVLASRLATAIARRPTLERPRDQYPAADTFLASVSRHNAAVLEVLVPVARRMLPDGHARAHEYTHQSRRLEIALAQVKAKLYGSTYAVHRHLSDIWEEVRREFDATWEQERRLAEDLDTHMDTSNLSERLYHAELRAPTRPHPYIPHQGFRGRVARRIARLVDGFWDTTEGRMIPEPIRTHDREHQGLLTQYLLADPHMHPEEPHHRH